MAKLLTAQKAPFSLNILLQCVNWGRARETILPQSKCESDRWILDGVAYEQVPVRKAGGEISSTLAEPWELPGSCLLQRWMCSLPPGENGSCHFQCTESHWLEKSIWRQIMRQISRSLWGIPPKACWLQKVWIDLFGNLMIILKQELDFRNCMGAEKMSESHISAHTVQERWNQDAKWNRTHSAVGLEKKNQ